MANASGGVMKQDLHGELDVYSEVPGYSQIAQWIRERIHRGRYQHGERLPAIRELAERFGVSRSTVHNAVRQLTADGLLEVRRGSGVTVAPQKIPYNPLLHFEDQYADSGKPTRIEVLGTGFAEPHEETVEALGIAPTEKIWSAFSVGYLDDVPVLGEAFDIPRDFAEPFLGESKKFRNFYRVLETEMGYSPLEVDLVRIDMLAERYMTEIMGMPESVTLYEIWRVISFEGKPLFTSCIGLRGDKCSLSFRARTPSDEERALAFDTRRTSRATMHRRFTEVFS